MKQIMFAFVAVLSLASTTGCKKKAGGGADMTGKYTEFKDAMCKCKAGDAACANKVQEDMNKWTKEQAASMGTEAAKMDPKEAEEMTKKITPIMTEYGKCMTAAMTPAMAGSAAEPPAAKEDMMKKEEPKEEPKKEEMKKDEPAKDEPKKDEPAKKE